MRVLLISPLPPPAGGIASWTKRYIESKTAQENEVDIINISVTGERVNNFTQKKKLLEEVRRFYSIISKLNNSLKTKKYDIVHMNSSCSQTGLIRDLISAYIIKKNKTKLLVHFRCDVTFMLKSKISVMLFNKIVRLSDHVLTLNAVSHNYILNNLQTESTVLPNYISDDYVVEIEKEKEINPTVSNLLFVGHVTQSKGCDLIYEVAEEFPEKNFILVGHISNEFFSKKKPNNVILKGELPLECVKEEYINSDVFLFPTHTEGFPNVISEAMACGMPVISTPVGAIPDMLEKSGGIIIPVNNKEECIKAINRIEDPRVRKTMSEFNRNKVKDHYIIDNILRQLFDIYKNI